MNVPLTLVVVICAFHREALLARLLASLAAQTLPAGMLLKAVVVDNTDAGTAASVVAAARQNGTLDLQGIEAHPANISVARNAGVQAAGQADWIAFLDDDQEVASGWLEAVAAGLAAFPHDAFFGRNEAVFARPECATPLVRRLFSRHLDAPAGHDLFAMGPQQTPGIALATSNAIIRRSALPASDGPFDPALGRSGGEDYDLFCRMQQQGCRFGWLPGALAHEMVPASRCEHAYLQERFFGGGQTYARAVVNSSERPALAVLNIRLRALVQAMVLAARWPLIAMQGREARRDFAYRWAGMRGKLAHKQLLALYSRHSGPAVG